MALLVRVKPRAERQIDAAAAWWSENRLAAPGAIRSDLKAALEVSVDISQPSDFLTSEAGLERMDGICMILIATGEEFKRIDRQTEGKLFAR